MESPENEDAVAGLGIVPAPGWETVADALREEPGVALLLGATDAGKSSFARYLAAALTAGGSDTALVDADVGQSGLCLPGTVSRAFFPAGTPLRYRCSSFLFLGSPSPLAVFRRLVQAAALMVREALRTAPLVVVDSSGLVSGPAGKALKLAKIREISPTHVIAIQRRDECEPLLRELDEVRIHRLHPSPAVRPRGRERRARSREASLLRFLRGEALEERILGLDGVRLLHLGADAPRDHPLLHPGTIVGLNAQAETLALGVVAETGKEGITLLSRRFDRSLLREIVFGEIALPFPLPLRDPPPGHVGIFG